MPVHDSEEMHALVVDEPSAFQEVAQEALWLEQQRKYVQDQRALLDLQRAELEQHLTELQLQDAFLDALSRQLDLREALLASDYEVVRMTGNRQSPRLPRR